MKILAISNLYPPNAIGGYEALCFDVMQALSLRGHEVVVLTSSYGGKEADYDRQEIIRELRLLASPDNIYEAFSCSAEERAEIHRGNTEILKRTLATVQPDIVFVWNLHFLEQPFLNALNELSCNKVFLLTDNWLIAACQPDFIADYFVRQVYGCGNRSLSLLKRVGMKLRSGQVGWEHLWGFLRGRMSGTTQSTCDFKGSAVFASHFMQQLYAQANIRFSDPVIIHHGTMPLPEPSEERPDRDQLIEPGELRLLFAGRVVEIKGVHTIIEALPGICRNLRHLSVSLTIVGDTRDQPYLKRLQSLLEKLNLQHIVNFQPPVQETALPQLFDAHDIYVFPSLYEPFALTLIHALRAGIPTVASRAGGTPEIIFERETGFLFDAGRPEELADRVIEMAQSHALRKVISSRSIATAEDFTFDRMINDIEKHLDRVHQEQL